MVTKHACGDFKDSWPSLFYEKEDIIPSAKKSNQALSLKNKVYNSYYFVSDFLSSTKNEIPKNWVDAQKDPSRALFLGFPQEIQRPELMIHSPVYTIPEIGYFIGDGEFTNRMNACLFDWSQDDFEKTFHCLNKLRVDDEKKTIEISRQDREILNVVNGFYFLDFINQKIERFPLTKSEKVKLEKNPKEKKVENDEDNYFDAKKAYNAMRPCFSMGSFQLEESEILPDRQISLDLKTYQTVLENPIFFKKRSLYKDSKIKTQIQGKNLDPKKWLEQVLPLVLMNTMSIHNSFIVWDRAYRASERLLKYIDLVTLETKNNSSPILSEPNTSKVNNEIFLAPQNKNDIKKFLYLTRANIFILTKDPESALLYITKGVDLPGHDEMNSLLFQQIANVYFDMGVLRLARRTYSWSEILSQDYAKKVPSVLFFGAESAFWNGDYAIAEKAFERFLYFSGDSKYSPYAYLRLGQIKEIQKNDKDSVSLYEKITRLFPSNAASKEAQVKLFCRSNLSLTEKTRSVEYNKVLEKLKDSSFNLQKQAHACLLQADLQNLKSHSKDKTKLNVLEKSNLQIEKIKKYQEVFPNTEFISLFTQRIEELKLAEGAFLSQARQCEKLMNYYEKNYQKLNYLSVNNNHYVANLKWDQEDNKRILRCGFLKEDEKIIHLVHQYFDEHENKNKETAYFNLMKENNAQNILDVFYLVHVGIKNWKSNLQTVHVAKYDLIDNKDFWEYVLLRKFLKSYYESDQQTKKLASQALFQYVMDTPVQFFQVNIYCNWLLEDFDKLTENEKNYLITSIETNRWLYELSQKEKTCSETLARSIFHFAFKQANKKNDIHLVIPYLRYKNTSFNDEEWLSIAQTRENILGKDHPFILEIYTKLAQNSKDKTIQNIAKAHIQNSLESNPDRVLWR